MHVPSFNMVIILFTSSILIIIPIMQTFSPLYLTPLNIFHFQSAFGLFIIFFLVHMYFYVLKNKHHSKFFNYVWAKHRIIFMCFFTIISTVHSWRYELHTISRLRAGHCLAEDRKLVVTICSIALSFFKILWIRNLYIRLPQLVLYRWFVAFLMLTNYFFFFIQGSSLFTRKSKTLKIENAVYRSSARSIVKGRPVPSSTVCFFIPTDMLVEERTATC